MTSLFDALSVCLTWGTALAVTAALLFGVFVTVTSLTASAWFRLEDWLRRGRF